MKHKIVISKKWKHPEISVEALVESLEISMSIDDFLSCLLEQIGSPTFIMTKEQLKQKVLGAKEEIVKEMKKASVNI